MTEASEKSIAQIAYEAFLVELAKSPETADEAEHAPPWEAVPEHVRIVIANAVGAAVRSFAPALDCELNPDEQSFAQVGYQAYVARTGGLNYQGLPCPTFEALTDTIKAAWTAAATAIRSEHEHRFAGEYDLAVSREELAELIAGIDSLQRADVHQAEIAFPLRSRLRSLLNQAEAALENQDEPLLADTNDEPPLNAPPLPEDASETDLPPAARAPLENPIPAPGSPPGEPDTSGPETEPSPPVDANTVDQRAFELPSPSKAPPAPGLPGLAPVIPGPPAMPTDIDAPTGSEPEQLTDSDITTAPDDALENPAAPNTET